MVHRARPEATRHRIIDAAVDLFADDNYSRTTLNDIIERTQLSKGAFYHHFDSKQSVAAAIIDEGAFVGLDAFRRICETSAPALENLLSGMLAVVEIVGEDKMARVAGQLIRALGEFKSVTLHPYLSWLAALTTQAQRASAQGALGPHLDPVAVGNIITSAMVGAEFMSYTASGGADFLPRLIETWEILLPALVTDESLTYYQEFLARKSRRFAPPPPVTE